MPTTKKVKLISKKEFATTAMNKNFETFLVHVASVIEIILIHLARKAQIAVLQVDKTPIKIPVKYSDYANVFSSDLEMELFENTDMNEHIIKLINRK